MSIIEEQAWPFQFIDPNDVWSFFSNTYGGSEEANSLQAEMLQLADSAMHCFCGEFPILTPQCDEFLPLPWRYEYCDEGDEIWRLLTADDMKPHLYPSKKFDPRFRQWGYRGPLSTTKEIVQAIAVETVMFADKCIGFIRLSHGFEAMKCTSAVYQGLFDIAHVVYRHEHWEPIARSLKQ